jgi:hypothetical protein
VLTVRSEDAGRSGSVRRLAVGTRTLPESPVRTGSSARDRSDRAKSDSLRNGMDWPWLESSSLAARLAGLRIDSPEEAMVRDHNIVLVVWNV